MIDCREAVARMWAYLEAGLSSESSDELDGHLHTCVRCCGELEFSRHLRARVAGPDRVPLPSNVRARVEGLIGTADKPIDQ